MKALIAKKYIIFGFIIALAILLTVNYFSYKNINEHFEDEKYVSDAVNTITICENLMTNLHEASSSRRGYLITSDEGFLNQYHSTINLVDTLFDELKNLPSNNAKEIKVLD